MLVSLETVSAIEAVVLTSYDGVGPLYLLFDREGLQQYFICSIVYLEDKWVFGITADLSNPQMDLTKQFTLLLIQVHQRVFV